MLAQYQILINKVILEMNKRSTFLILLIIFLGFIATVIKELRNEESYDKIHGLWRVDSIYINHVNVISDYKRKYLNPRRRRNEISIPIHKEVQIKEYDKSAHWKYYRIGLFEGQLEIYDSQQGILDGIYEIEILDHRKPNVMRLFSDSIAIICIEEYLSQDKPYILHEWEDF